jgi:nucleotide-binding universal stress UspA family protein
MKIIVGYDGSACSDAALDDLKKAGLPEEKVEAVIISVAEVWLPPPLGNESLTEYAQELQTRPQPFKAYKRNAKAVTEAEAFAKHARNRLQAMFPAWKITAEANYGSPAWEILSKAEELKPDLIVVGSQGRSALGRFFLGSISNKILSEARCSVRVARGRVEVDPAPARIVIGFDGSPGAKAAVEAVVQRNWREGSEICLIAVSNPLLPTAIGLFVPPITNWVEEELKTESEWIEEVAAESLDVLRSNGLQATLRVFDGNPKQILAEEAERWHADSIFVGANRFGGAIERFLLGSVSAAIAARAHCSVEVVRRNSK